MIPRDPSLKTAYRSSKIQRPKLKLHGVWAFNYVLRLAVLDESSHHGSSLVQELLARTLEDCVEISRQKGIPPPDTVIVIGDNTVKELKNSYCMSPMGNLILHRKIRPLGGKMFFGC